MENKIELRNGWWWPTSDQNCWNYLNQYNDVPKKCASYVKDKNVVVQAGGNCGFYVKQYANMFKTVYTFEPNSLNFLCLNKNVEDENVIKIQSCLGSNNELVGMRDRSNIGRHHIIKDAKQKTIPTLTIDNLGLDECNLIHLDIEGFELFALHGAKDTLKNCHPTVILESVDNNSRYGYTDDEILNYLAQFNYELVGSVYTDLVFQVKK